MSEDDAVEWYRERVGRQAAGIAQLRGRVASLEKLLRECWRTEEERHGNEGLRSEAGEEPR